MVSLVFLGLAIVCALISRILLLIAAIDISAWWALGVFLPFGPLFFRLNYPEQARNSYLFRVATLLCIFGFVVMRPRLNFSPRRSHRTTSFASPAKQTVGCAMEKPVPSKKTNPAAAEPTLTLDQRHATNAKELERLHGVEEQLKLRKRDLLHSDTEGNRLYTIDLEKSRGSYMYDEATGRRLIDLYGFFGSLTIGFNHPYFDEPSAKEDLLRAAKFKVANSDIYSEGYAEFVDAFSRVAGFPPLERYLFIEGGALAIENTLKAAMDWKVRKNLAAGRGERGTEILHFRHAFHGRSGYTMSLTNTDPRKTDLFAKFNWPRVSNPAIDFSLPENDREGDVIEREKQSEAG